jgi:hypothetical protein
LGLLGETSEQGGRQRTVVGGFDPTTRFDSHLTESVAAAGPASAHSNWAGQWDNVSKPWVGNDGSGDAR